MRAFGTRRLDNADTGSAGADEEAEEIHDRTVRYSGKERDATGLLYYGWRYYQPGVGRWLSADPGGLIDGVNLFRFCRNDSVCGYDEDGLVYQGAMIILRKNIEGWEIIARGVDPQTVQGRRLWGKAAVFDCRKKSESISIMIRGWQEQWSSKQE